MGKTVNCTKLKELMNWAKEIIQNAIKRGGDMELNEKVYWSSMGYDRECKEEAIFEVLIAWDFSEFLKDYSSESEVIMNSKQDK